MNIMGQQQAVLLLCYHNRSPPGVPCSLLSTSLHALVSRLKVVWAMAELSALARLMRARKHDGLRSSIGCLT